MGCRKVHWRVGSFVLGLLLLADVELLGGGLALGESVTVGC